MLSRILSITVFLLTALVAVPAFPQTDSLLRNLAQMPTYESHRISSYDRTGGNADRLTIEPGETKVLAEIQGPAAITHIWNTIDAENYYSRMLILRFYWDGQETPSVEVPIGDFFAVGHGLNRPFQSFPVNVSSEGRARNCYWFMPFQKSAKVTVTHEGFKTCRAFYYYIDYRTYDSLPDDSLYFHAHYRQATPNPKVELNGINIDGKTNYLLMETEGKGLYAGTVLSVQINKDGWFGEGDDMFFVDGVDTPTMTGTGSEDYFNDAWGFREFCYPYHGVTVWEGYTKGDRGTAYKWHIFDPVAFTTSLRATIEHGHANDREDDFYTVAFWYQTLPSPEPPPLPEMFDRLPDEGQLYAKRISLTEKLIRYQQQGRFDAALRLVDQFERENELADTYGFCSMRRGVLLKQMGELSEAEGMLSAALEKSKKEDPKSAEQDAGHIRWVAERELPILQERKRAYLYALADDTYEVFIDGDSVGQGRSRDRLRDHEIELSRGTHIIAVKCENRSGDAGFALQLSHRRGYVFTDATWKVSSVAGEGWLKQKFDDSTWSNAVEVGVLGEASWDTSRQPFAFVAPLLLARAIWTPEGAQDNQTVCFRKEIRVK
ncbi:MAG: glycoside hydrolase family 172 protein [bacterium]